MLDQGDQHPFDRGGLPGVAAYRWYARVQVERDAHVLRVMCGGSVEAVDGDNERHLTFLEVVHGREAVGEPAGVGQDHGAERPIGQFVPHEPEAVLARRAEQVQQQVAAEGDPAEVHRDGGGPLVLHPGQIVIAGADGGQEFLGAQRPDLADRTDEGRLTGAEAARDNDLEYGEWRAGAVLRGRGVHAAPPRADRRSAVRRPAGA